MNEQVAGTVNTLTVLALSNSVCLPTSLLLHAPSSQPFSQNSPMQLGHSSSW